MQVSWTPYDILTLEWIVFTVLLLFFYARLCLTVLGVYNPPVERGDMGYQDHAPGLRKHATEKFIITAQWTPATCLLIEKGGCGITYQRLESFENFNKTLNLKPCTLIYSKHFDPP